MIFLKTEVLFFGFFHFDQFLDAFVHMFYAVIFANSQTSFVRNIEYASGGFGMFAVNTWKHQNISQYAHDQYQSSAVQSKTGSRVDKYSLLVRELYLAGETIVIAALTTLDNDAENAS